MERDREKERVRGRMQGKRDRVIREGTMRQSGRERIGERE